MRDSELAEALADGSYRPPDLSAKPCTVCGIGAIIVVDGSIYCGTHSWERRWAVVRNGGA
jgi:hypothetical protein